MKSDQPRVTIAEVKVINSSAIRASWTFPYDGTIKIDNCTIEYRKGMISLVWMEFANDINPEVLQYTMTGLDTYTYYYVRIVCFSTSSEVRSNDYGPVRTQEKRTYIAMLDQLECKLCYTCYIFRSNSCFSR